MSSSSSVAANLSSDYRKNLALEALAEKTGSVAKFS